MNFFPRSACAGRSTSPTALDGSVRATRSTRWYPRAESRIALAASRESEKRWVSAPPSNDTGDGGDHGDFEELGRPAAAGSGSRDASIDLPVPGGPTVSARLIVIRRAAKASPEAIIAERTRSRASKAALSGGPTMVKAGMPGATAPGRRRSESRCPSNATGVTRWTMSDPALTPPSGSCAVRTLGNKCAVPFRATRTILPRTKSIGSRGKLYT